MELNFWINQVIKIATLFLIAYLCGLWVERGGIKVNYTRKINHFALFFLPFFFDRIFPFEETNTAFILLAVIAMASLAIYSKPIRESSEFVNIMYRSMDRPEDRPYTMIWLVTQFAATFVVLVPLGIYLAGQGLQELVYIPVLINGVGDGLAEPVGVRYGRYQYQTRALFTDRRYIRTLEGSACVLITGIITVILFQYLFTPAQFIVALLTVPILLTLAEAFSPHTWDSPFMFLVGGVALILISNFVG
jgi:dolichol kinase